MFFPCCLQSVETPFDVFEENSQHRQAPPLVQVNDQYLINLFLKIYAKVTCSMKFQLLCARTLQNGRRGNASADILLSFYGWSFVKNKCYFDHLSTKSCEDTACCKV
ncbi:Hypothetical predicted protein [Olea europaea subsp. europaea]|uniref:Uncharacterized protein n=1 Tax=Olea europaea subsp. europaea TaxID=158383 RepID=A0A8S0VA25_OLEEU|nr:Hypothetical predicted protein [Olea europaea subsp. europaea]